MIQVMCRLNDGRELMALTTDSPNRAALIAHTVNANGRYAAVFVIIGNKHFAYSDFIKQLEKIS